MNTTLKDAVELVCALPDPVQEEIGLLIRSRLAKLDRLKAEIAKAEQEIASGRYEELTPEVWNEIRERARSKATAA